MARPKVDPVVIDFSNITGGGTNGDPISQLVRPRQTFSRVFKGPQTAGTPKELRIDRDVWLVYATGKGVGLQLSRAPMAVVAGAWNSQQLVAYLEGTQAQAWIGNESFNVGDSLWLDSSGGMGGADFCLCIFAFGPVQNAD